MAVLELLPPRTVPGREATRFRPWVEVSALARVDVPVWRHAEELWLHTAAPAVGRGVALDRAVPFSPGRRARTPGEPRPEQRDGECVLDAAEAEAVALAMLGTVRRTLYRQPEVGAVSRLGESAVAFRRRVLAAAAPLVRQRGRDEALAAALARLAASIEERQLEAGELSVQRLLVGVVWYPAEETPGCASDDLMLTGAPVPWR